VSRPKSPTSSPGEPEKDAKGRLKRLGDALPLLDAGGKQYCKVSTATSLHGNGFGMRRVETHYILMPDGKKVPINGNVVDGLRRRKIEIIEVKPKNDPMAAVVEGFVTGDQAKVQAGLKLGAAQTMRKHGLDVQEVAGVPIAKVELHQLEAAKAALDELMTFEHGGVTFPPDAKVSTPWSEIEPATVLVLERAQPVTGERDRVVSVGSPIEYKKSRVVDTDDEGKE
jgi:hypothetical protein